MKGRIILVLMFIILIGNVADVKSQTINGKLGWQRLNHLIATGSVELSNWEGGLGFGYLPKKKSRYEIFNFFTSLTYQFGKKERKANIFIRGQITYELLKDYKPLVFSIPNNGSVTPTPINTPASDGNRKYRVSNNFYSGLNLGAKFKLNDRFGIEMDIGSFSELLVWRHALNFEFSQLFILNGGINIVYVLKN